MLCAASAEHSSTDGGKPAGPIGSSRAPPSRLEARWRQNGVMDRDPRRSARPRPMVVTAVWVARIALLVGTVGVPLLLAVSTWDDPEAWPWIRYVLPPMFVICAVAGGVYSRGRWDDPPYWAWLAGRVLWYRKEWNQR